MINKKKWLIALTTAGVLAATPVLSARDMTEHVNGLLRGDVLVKINGADTSLHPVYIDGRAYLPVREAASTMGYEVHWKGSEIELNKQEEDEAEAMLQMNGIIVNSETKGDSVRLEVLGHGPNNWMFLTIDKNTWLTDLEGNQADWSSLKEGTQITAEYGPIIAMSYPGQSHAAAVQIGTQRHVQENVVASVDNHAGDGWRIQLAEQNGDASKPALVLNAGKETMLVDREGRDVPWTQLKPGIKVRSYYGPAMTKSIPPQSPAHLIVVLDDTLEQSTEAEYQELAWSYVPDTDKNQLITKRGEAEIRLIAAGDASIMAADDKQKEILAKLAAEGVKVVAATYRTEMDALIGPLTVVINPESKELIGFFIRM
ncbi:copper amine oxidase N-terminal domain-containing protein [Paenibacillus tarimensis]|uniref:copper amine oxidase N-terminal domain-containing protein n=1 Tax=Paenibacillus tarimensis TaxID=416012 RepID=UPI001F2E69CC|nr:copper amine oxidase N-terminal domain-containing protein [Paenibacillus tarimensis]MCF2944625.1 copper amine oxidase N-terminal domain-containing protein [Paenibacillus tarimensis]